MRIAVIQYKSTVDESLCHLHMSDFPVDYDICWELTYEDIYDTKEKNEI